MLRTDREIADLERGIIEDNQMYKGKLAQVEQNRDRPERQRKLRGELEILSAQIQGKGERLLQQKKLQHQFIRAISKS